MRRAPSPGSRAAASTGATGKPASAAFPDPEAMASTAGGSFSRGRVFATTAAYSSENTRQRLPACSRMYAISSGVRRLLTGLATTPARKAPK
jgi:hypothetical protein